MSPIAHHFLTSLAPERVRTAFGAALRETHP